MTTIAFATCVKAPGLTASDALLAEALRVRGANVVSAPWNGDFCPFAAADLTIVRSTWDYYDVTGDFAGWIDRVEEHGVIVNPPAVLKWNMTKAYLFDLAEKGAPVPPMRKIAPNVEAIAEAMDALKLDEAIVKPLAGGTASGLSQVNRADDQALAAAAAILNGEGLVMPIIPEITTAGETSLIFIGGEFSHAVLKLPKAGDIRVQEEHGGSSRPVSVADWAIEEARHILSRCPIGTAYARVDAIMREKQLTLMEVELVEPELFFTLCPAAADRLAEIVIEMV